MDKWLLVFPNASVLPLDLIGKTFRTGYLCGVYVPICLPTQIHSCVCFFFPLSH